MTLYNKKGKAAAYIENDVIWTFDGRAVAYLFQEAVYNFPGKQLGWFEKGWLRSNEPGKPFSPSSFPLNP